MYFPHLERVLWITTHPKLRHKQLCTLIEEGKRDTVDPKNMVSKIYCFQFLKIEYLKRPKQLDC